MTLGETLLNLTLEYRDAVQVRDDYPSVPGDVPGREPEVIAAEYEQALRGLLADD